jgi:Ca2+-binding EF-hand superfamily protein
MTKLFALNVKRTVVSSALILLAVSGIALAAPAGSSTGTHTESQGHGPRHDGKRFNPFARFDQDGDGKILLKDLPLPAKTHLSVADANHDGTLTLQEFQAGKQQLRADFEKRADTNHDGKVTPEERQAVMKAHLDERFNGEDKNHDGALTADEVGKEKFEHLLRADANKDGRVTKAELHEAFKAHAMGPRDHEGNCRKDKSPEDRQAKAIERFKQMDKNSDGALVQSEVPGRWDHLKQADANGDSKVTAEELKSAFESGKMGPHGRGRGDHGKPDGTRGQRHGNGR